MTVVRCFNEKCAENNGGWCKLNEITLDDKGVCIDIVLVDNIKFTTCNIDNQGDVLPEQRFANALGFYCWVFFFLFSCIKYI